ncbi:major facilitator superfamily domain-containing protein [Colletotrichum navitas]|uniref:Major facilitator superfamily domain-containing protein n=1 Tax=Colletotrichum navitas TaxID=681940 RepID=A0AAD8PSR5_9PEZI|nr:major facilitator superfamily domain-containing protein [Colletotrichum navitas]KAK1579362.1 major facilitator superfamily domain-containing protein [Colletotrichum navitas]
MHRTLFSLPWAYLPKDKAAAVAVIASVRVVDFYQIASFQTCVTLHLQYLQPDLSTTELARHVGVAQGMFTAAQILSAPIWGIAVDRIGRKTVILIGLISTAIACVGVAFARSIGAVVFWRLLAGATNGTVVAARTAMSDNLPPQSLPAGFSLLVLSFHVANAIGPLIAAASMGPHLGWLSISASSESGSATMAHWEASNPYTMPNLISALVLTADALLVWYKLKEVHNVTHREWHKLVIRSHDWIRQCFHRYKWQYRPVTRYNYEHLIEASDAVEMQRDEPQQDSERSKEQMEPIWRLKFLIVLCTVAILEFHLGAFGSLWPLFVVADRRKPEAPVRLPFVFSGGLQLKNSDIGLAVGALGFIGVILQLTAVPHITTKFGAVRAFKATLPLFPASLFIAPYLTFLTPDSPHALWLGLLLVLFLHVLGRSFGILVTILLVNQSTAQPSRRGTVHGIANTVASTFRTAGSIAGGSLFGLGVERNLAGLGWWITGGVSILGWALGPWV